jgi:outer membrane protein assembly factor BamB
MKILCLPDILDFCNSFGDPSVLYARLSAADVKSIGECFEYIEYGRWSWKRRNVLYEDKIYKVERVNEADTILLSSYQNGHCYLVDSKGKKLVARAEIVSLIANNYFNKYKVKLWRGSKIIGRVYLSRRKSVFTLADIETGDIKQLEGVRVANPCLLDDSILFFNDGDWHVYALNHELDITWKFRPDVNFAKKNVRGPEVYQDHVIISFGTSRSEKFPGPVYEGVQFADHIQSFDSNLYALNIRDGSLCWHVTIPKTIDNMVIMEDKLYISSTNEIHIIDPKTGKTEKVVDTGLSEYVDQSLDPSSLHIQGDKLYFCHQVDACLLVYRLDDLQLIKRINIPEPYSIKEFEYHHEATGKLYFNLVARFPRLYYHTSPALELDPAELDSDIELVTGPPVDIELRAAELNPDEREIWITMRDVPLDEAMVYAEMHTEDQAFYHGKNGMYQALHKTDDFNGKVHFRYSGSDRPAKEVNEKLRILEKRFADWGRTIAFASTDPGKNATLEAQYLE